MTAVHDNSHDANKALTDKETRQRRIMKVVRGAGHPLTDREIKDSLGYVDMNSVRPRVTELVGDGVLVECGKRRCGVTGLSVRTVKAARLF